jgi:hypothetical protein
MPFKPLLVGKLDMRANVAMLSASMSCPTTRRPSLSIGGTDAAVIWNELA